VVEIPARNPRLKLCSNSDEYTEGFPETQGRGLGSGGGWILGVVFAAVGGKPRGLREAA